MESAITLKSEELQLMSLIQDLTGVTAKDCIFDSKLNRVILVVDSTQMGLVIGKKGMMIKKLKKITGKLIEIVEYSDDPVKFVTNILNPDLIENIKLTKNSNNNQTIVVNVDGKNKGAVVGKNGRNAEKARSLSKKYFQINNIQIL
jgi:N utilization substance protein A